MAQMFEDPKQGHFTQGTIFSCAYAENYEGLSVYGLVITARCDAAQNKVPIYSFIPVVSLEDWIFRDGAEIVLQRLLSDCDNTKKNILSGMEVSDSLLRSKTGEEILTVILRPMVEKDQRKQVKIEKFSEADELSKEIRKALAGVDVELRRTLLRRAGKALDSIVKELAGNKLTGYYLLREMPTLNARKLPDFVALLREVHHVPSVLAMRILRGIAKEEWKTPPSGASRSPCFSDSDDYCAPVARLRSPWMEHLMQTWSLLFARIGVDDIDAAALRKSLCDIGLEMK